MAIEMNLLTKNQSYFEEWSSEMAYDLGYIFADGSVRVRRGWKLRLRCKTSDEKLIEGIKNRLGNTSPLVRSIKKGTSFRNSHIELCGKRLVESIINLGVVPRKSFVNTSFPHVPDVYLPHFLRGNLDGDGCVYVAAGGAKERACVSWLGCEGFIRGLQMSIERVCRVGRVTPNDRGRGLFGIGWTRKSDIREIYHYLYPVGKYPCLNRKRELFEHFLSGVGELFRISLNK